MPGNERDGQRAGRDVERRYGPQLSPGLLVCVAACVWKEGKNCKEKKTKLRVINRRGEAERGTGGEGGDREEE